MPVAGWFLNPRERAYPSRACHRGDGARAEGNVGLAAFAGTSGEGPFVMRPGVGGKVEQAGNSASLEAVARVGLIAYGVVHLLISWLALQLAWGAAARKSADPSGALRTVADQPVGRILLWLVALGLVALALWQASEAIWGYRNREGAKRKQIASGTKAVTYAALGVSAGRVAFGSGQSSSARQREATSGVLALPAGRVMVVAAGM